MSTSQINRRGGGMVDTEALRASASNSVRVRLSPAALRWYGVMGSVVMSNSVKSNRHITHNYELITISGTSSVG